jgi:protein gp37
VGENTQIEWTDHTFSPWWGCTRVSPGCRHCYAETMAARFGTKWGNGAPRRFFEDKHWAKPVGWNTKAEKAGRPALVFCASMADVFEDNDDLLEQRYRLWDLIAATPWLVWQLLTKRPENVERLVPYSWMAEQWPTNVWVGTSVEDQKRADERVPVLLRIPAAVRFLSCEPLLGAVDVSRWLADVETCQRCNGSASVPVPGGGKACPDCYDDPNGQGACTVQRIQWVIAGGESGRGARPMHPKWATSLRDQCADVGVPFLFKQMGSVWAKQVGATDGAGTVLADIPENLRVRQWPAVRENVPDGFEARLLPLPPATTVHVRPSCRP